VQLDNSLRIIYANEPFLMLVEADREKLLGKNIEYTPVALVFDESFTGFIKNIREGIAGKEWSGEILLTAKDITLFCRIAPTVFEEGRRGVSVIFENITKRKQAERKIEESERQFRLLAENSIDMISRVKPDGTRIYVSPAYKTTLGFEPEELIGKRDEFIHPDDVEIMKSLGNALTEENSFATITFRTKHKDGHYLWIESNVKAIFDEKTRELSEYYNVTRDITERKKSEEKLQESEERYRKLVEISPDGVLLHGEGKIMYANPAAVNMLGASHSGDIIGKNVLDLVHPDFRDRVKKNIQSDLKGQTSPKIELLLTRFDGTSIMVEGRGTGTLINGIPAVQVAIRDITKQKQVENALHESEKKYRSIIDRANDVICIIQEGIIKMCNPRLPEFWGGSIEEIIGKPISEFIHPDARSEVIDRYNRRMAGESPPSIYETILMRKDGSKSFVELNAGIISFDGKNADLVIIRDINDRKKACDALRESEARVRLILDSTDDIIILQNPEGRYLYFNSAARYGVSEEEMLGKTPYDFIDKESADRIVERVKKVAKTGVSIREDSPFVWKGQTLWFSDSLSPVRDMNGTTTAVVTISQNITDRRKAEEELIQNEQRYRNLITATGDIVWETDAQSRFVYVSPQVEPILGYTPDELIGHTPFEFLHPDSIGLNHKKFQTAVVRHEKSVLHVSHWIHKDGHKVLLESNAIPLYDGKGSFSGFIGIDRQRQ
jgi:PAS domain S-box-containing protein